MTTARFAVFGVERWEDFFQPAAGRAPVRERTMKLPSPVKAMRARGIRAEGSRINSRINAC